MNSDQITGILRAAIAAGGGVVVGKGWLSGDMYSWLAGGAMTIGPAVWSWFTNRPASMAAKVQAIPGVTVQTAPTAPADVKAAVASVR